MASTDLLYQLSKHLLPNAARRTLRRWCVELFPHLRYPWWIARHVHDRRDDYPAPAIENLFSLLTPVYNTPPRFLRELADSVLGQDYPWFEWVLVDNGSTSPTTRTLLQRLADDSRAKIVRLPSNRGILAGTRTALEHARGRYVLPVDHDDRLYPDALRIMAWHLHEHGYPTAAYSDEDNLLPSGRPGRPFCKPDWDPLLLLNCCYVAHLSAIDRETALSLDCYSDRQTEGCPDWDAFLRLARAGHSPLHVPEILYSWRMHADSTASPYSRAKPYTIANQHHVLLKHLWHLNHDDRLTVRSNPLMRQTGLWRITRRHVDPTPRIEVIHLESNDCDRASPLSWAATNWHETTYPELHHRPLQWDQLLSTLANLPDSSLVAVVQGHLVPLSADWPWEALGLFELLDDLVVLGGRIVGPDGHVQSAGEVFGMSGILGSPCRGWPAATPRRHGMLLCQRTVSAVDGRFFVARAGFLARALAQRGAYRAHLLSAWLAAAAQHEGLRIAYSPHILVQAAAATGPSLQSDEECWQFVESHWQLLADDPYYSRFCSVRVGHGWELAEPQSRAAMLNATLSRLAGTHAEVATILAHGERFVARPAPHALPEYARLGGE
jgi:hypothetical protein